MKKSTKIAIIIAVIAIIGIVGIILTAIGINKLVNREKNSITANDFKTNMEQKGYSITDANNQFGEYDILRQVYIAIDDTYSYQIEFYEFLDVSYAIEFYNYNASIFESRKGNVASQSSLAGKNFSKYTLSSGEKYMVLSRINDTVMYISVDSQYKESVNKVAKELGY